ncbi:MAG: ABC transporter permease [Marmoricola sp.]
MSTTTLPYGDTLDISNTPGIPMSRLIKVEMRKMFDTRAGMWLLFSIGLITSLVLLIQIWVASAQNLRLHYTSFLTSMSIPMGILLPVLGVMAVTQEWGQRTGLVTFTMEPRRTRNVTSKLTVAVLIAVASITVALLLAVLGNLLYGAVGDYPVSWDATPGIILGFLGLQEFGLLIGFMLGMVFINTAGAIVAYFIYSFVLPGLFAWGSATIGWFHDSRPWFDFNFDQEPLTNGSLSGAEWAHLGVSGLIWFVLPMMFGIWRLLRTEVK